MKWTRRDDDASISGDGDVTFAAALVGTGTLILSGTGSLTIGSSLAGVAELSDTGLGFKHFEQHGSQRTVLRLG